MQVPACCSYGGLNFVAYLSMTVHAEKWKLLPLIVSWTVETRSWRKWVQARVKLEPWSRFSIFHASSDALPLPIPRYIVSIIANEVEYGLVIKFPGP
jgi:hypothetical protein